jgi:hypothetical protein
MDGGSGQWLLEASRRRHPAKLRDSSLRESARPEQEEVGCTLIDRKESIGGHESCFVDGDAVIVRQGKEGKRACWSYWHTSSCLHLNVTRCSRCRIQFHHERAARSSCLIVFLRSGRRLAW